MQFLIALDQLVNTLLDGWADETLSARCFRHRNKTKRWFICYKTLNAVFFWQADHCLESYDSELKRKQLPKEYQ